MSINGGQLADIANSLTHELNKIPSEAYRCLFYNNRVCHTREQMDISDDDLQKEIAVSKEARRSQLKDEEINFLGYENTQNTANWLVGRFCQICPHLSRGG